MYGTVTGEGSPGRKWALLGLIALAVVLIALIGPAGSVANAAKPPAYFVDESSLPFDALPGTETTRYWGVHGGAGYRIEVPADWNGELVLYAHGYRGNPLELTVTNPSIRQYLIDNGFAWAASSYATNGYDPAQGVKDTHALGVFFNGKVANPSRTYIMGHSMGGHVVGVAIEQYPNAFDGALPMCGVMGDNELFDYFVDFHLIAQALTGHETGFPFPEDYSTDAEIKADLGPNYPVDLNEAGEHLAAAVENISGGDRPLFDFGFANVWGNFLFDQGTTFGAGMVENEDTVYQFDSDPALTPEEQDLNDNIQRIALDPQYRHPNGLGGIPGINGTITIPVISMHTIGDLFVPFSMEQIYARRVAANGNSDLLVSRAIRDIGHCGFTTAEQENAFADLVNWVENGVKPAGDDILTPSNVASPDFGCQFTTSQRFYAPAC